MKEFQKSQESKFGIFKGEKVLLSNGLTQKDLDIPASEFITTLLSVSSARINGEPSLGISYYDLVSFFENKLKAYPQLDMIKMEINGFDKLQKDFPNIKSKENAFEISDKIVDFYEMKLRNDLKNELKDISSKGAKIKGVLEELDANAMEINYFAQHPIAGLSFKTGATLAISWSNEKFGGASIDLDNYRNAYKHAIWNMAGVAEMLKAGMPKSDAVGKARDFATLHEMIYVGNSNGIKPSALPASILILHANWGLNTQNANAMDLSNNSIGRSLIDDIAYKPLFGGWQNVDKTSIMNSLAPKVSSNAEYRKNDNIIHEYHGDNWDNLSSNRFGGTTTPLYIIID